MKREIILASSSPRRKELLGGLLSSFGLKFKVIPSHADESFDRRNSFPAIVKELALQKAKVVAETNDGIIISADTIVVLDKKILGKPSSKSDAKKMLMHLSGKTHKVYTGLVVMDTRENEILKTYECTKVTFRKLGKDEVDFYVKSGSPMDKAGAYGIQDDFGCVFIEKIEGDYFNVVGLPMMKLYLVLRKLNVC